MINMYEVSETNKMIESENLDVRRSLSDQPSGLH